MLQGRKVAAGCQDEVKCLLMMLPQSRPRVRSLKYYRVVDVLCNYDGNSRFDKQTYLGRFVAKRQEGERGRGILLIFDSQDCAHSRSEMQIGLTDTRWVCVASCICFHQFNELLRGYVVNCRWPKKKSRIEENTSCSYNFVGCRFVEITAGVISVIVDNYHTSSLIWHGSFLALECRRLT